MTNIIQTRQYQDLNLNMPVHPNTGDLAYVKNEIAIKRAVKNIIMTNFGEKPFNEYFGCDLRKSLFEPISNLTALGIQENIDRSLRANEPRIVLKKVDVIPDIDNNGYTVDIFFNIINSNQPAVINMFLEKAR